jgi:putative membrane protein
MLDLSGDAYLWLKALHIVSVIAWMAGLLYLPRLFVYHTDCKPGSAQSEIFKIMERRLLYAIMHPALVASLGFGLPLLLDLPASSWEEGWLHIKLVCVVGLVICHLWMGYLRLAFAEGRNTHSHRFFRVLNEVPTVLMIAIVICVVVKPF